MTAYNLIHFFTAVPGREAGLRQWLVDEAAQLLDDPALTAVTYLRLQAVQMQPSAPQPWPLAALYEIQADEAAAALPRIDALRRQARGLGLLRDDAAHLFELTRPNLPTPNGYDPAAPLHLTFVMGNCIVGKEVQYDAWYDQVHAPEVLGTPDFVAMRRGLLAQVQSVPGNPQPANRIVILGIRSHDLQASIAEFIARALGTSPSGVKWSPREAAAGFASLERTTHVFTPFHASGRFDPLGGGVPQDRLGS